jgi:hypothetical protein
LVVSSERPTGNFIAGHGLVNRMLALACFSPDAAIKQVLNRFGGVRARNARALFD